LARCASLLEEPAGSGHSRSTPVRRLGQVHVVSPSESIIVSVMTVSHLRPATRADLPRIHQVRHGTTENRLTNPALVTDDEVAWYLDKAIFLVSEDDKDIQGFVCANQQTGYVWALFVIDEAQGRGHGTALLDAAMDRLRAAGHRQAFLTTGKGTKAENFYKSKGWQCTGTDLRGEAVFRLWL
jgi:GNAT superfamily N-acetyltransferase